MKKVMLLVLALLCVITSCKVEDSSSSVVPPVEFPDELVGFWEKSGAIVINKKTLTLFMVRLRNDYFFTKDGSEVKETIRIENSIATPFECNIRDNTYEYKANITGICAFEKTEETYDHVLSFDGVLIIQFYKDLTKNKLKISYFELNIKNLDTTVDKPIPSSFYDKQQWNDIHGDELQSYNKIHMGLFFFPANKITIEEIEKSLKQNKLNYFDIFEYNYNNRNYIFVITTFLPNDDYSSLFIAYFRHQLINKIPSNRIWTNYSIPNYFTEDNVKNYFRANAEKFIEKY